MLVHFFWRGLVRICIALTNVHWAKKRLIAFDLIEWPFKRVENIDISDANSKGILAKKNSVITKFIKMSQVCRDKTAKGHKDSVMASFWARVLCSLAAEDACFRMRITMGVVLIRSLVFHVCVPECSGI